MPRRFSRALGFSLSLGALALLGLLVGSAQAQAEPARKALGFGHFLNNDVLGDGKDRWQSGSYTMSWLRGPGWTGSLPGRPFEILEYRLGGAIISPAHGKGTDRRYVARSMLSLHTPFAAFGGTEADLGLGLVWTGPANGLSDFQKSLHDLLHGPTPQGADRQLPNHLYPMASAELARPVALGRAELRPFVEARAGDETLLRLGADLAFGAREPGALWLRDEITGHRSIGIAGDPQPGIGFVIGADVAHVFDSAWFPADGVTMEPTRTRLRAGVTTRLAGVGVFYGLTWLSKEFEGQPEAQLLGSLRLRMRF